MRGLAAVAQPVDPRRRRARPGPQEAIQGPRDGRDRSPTGVDLAVGDLPRADLRPDRVERFRDGVLPSLGPTPPPRAGQPTVQFGGAAAQDDRETDGEQVSEVADDEVDLDRRASSQRAGEPGEVDLPAPGPTPSASALDRENTDLDGSPAWS